MADVNNNAPAGKSNCYLDLDKSQSNPIYKIAVDLLKHTNFFRAFTASSTIPSIYIKQFWDTVQYDKTAGCYRCQLDEQWFVLTKDTQREALQITPVNNNQAFINPPSSDALINFVNELGYPKLVRNLSNVVTNDMFQPWRALTTIVNLCLTGNTSGFEIPRALVLHILWGIITRAHIDYVERIWEEFTQSIHTFIDDKRNLTRHTSGKKKATLIVILSIRFTKLIIHHLQRRHKFHPRPDSPLHLPNEEPVLGYLKFSAKGTNREVIGMPIPGSLITADIQEASYYQEYLKNVAKHRRYTSGETRSDPDSPASKPTKHARKPKSTAPKAPPRPSVSTSVTSAQHEPTSAPTEPQRKKLAEDTAAKELQVGAKDADMRKALEESLKSMYDVPQDPLPPVVIREPESGKYQPLPEVLGKGKVKVTEEQVAHDLLSLQKPKKKSPADQYIFQRRTSIPTGSFGLDESSYDKLGQSDSKDESKKVVPRADARGQGEGQAGPDPGAQAKGQEGPDFGAQDEGQDGSNLDEQSEGQAGPDPGNTGADEKPMPSPVVYVGSDREHMDLDVADVSPQPSTEQMDEGFTATAYPKVQENLKLTVEDQVLLEEPASSSGTLSSLQHLSKDINFGDLLFSDKPSKADNDKANVETEVESMVSVTIQQDMSSIPPMTSPIIDLTLRPESLKVHQQFKATAIETTTTTTTTLHPQPYQQQSTAEELAQDLAEARKKKKKSRESPKTPPGSPPHQPPPPPPQAGPSGALGAPGASRSSQVPPPPPPPSSTNQESPSKGSAVPSSSKTAASAEYQAWTMTDIRLKPSISLTHADLKIDDDMAPDEQAHSSDDEDIESAHILKVNLRQDWWKHLKEERPATPEPTWSISSSDVPIPTNNWASALASNYLPPPKDSLLVQTGDIATFMDWFCKRRGITELNPQDMEGLAFKIVKVFHPDVIHL
nr:monodehydroascorbate reductase [Tanacetum cinerariifolium]